MSNSKEKMLKDVGYECGEDDIVASSPKEEVELKNRYID